jgi:hypothetical protein
MSRVLILSLLAMTLAGCRSAVSQYDAFEKVNVHRMVGNEVNFAVLSRTVVCLNAMREARWPGPVTNQTVTLQTNYTVTSVTNQTVNNSSLEQVAANTNAVVSFALSLQPADTSSESVTNVPAAAQPPDSSQAGLTVSTLQNESVATAPNQSVVSRTLQTISLVSSQSTVNTNQQSLLRGSNQTITAETNWVITTVTNQTVLPVTNTVVSVPDGPAMDYFLYTEIAPQDFSLAPGENLVLLVDGVRSSFAPATPLSGWQPRRGYLTTFYKVPAELIAAIANAQEVRLRLRGATGTLERTLSSGSRKNFRDFLLENFAGETAGVERSAAGS